MIVIGRTRTHTAVGAREEIDIVGSTGNIYRVTIGHIPTCTCPDHLKGHECKHKVYALHIVLKAPEHLQYQLAFTSSELGEIFEHAPPIPTQTVALSDTPGKRKPVDGECPICYMDLDEEHNELVWCKAACGNNMHRGCFDQWASSVRGNQVRCVYCRSPWHLEETEVAAIVKTATINDEGYFNVANHFGLSQERDYSSYSPFWVRRQFGSR